MRASVSAIIVLCLAGLAQQPDTRQSKQKPDADCYQDKGVDEYIAELRKAQKRKATWNPLPNVLCGGAGCKETGIGPQGQPVRVPAPPTVRDSRKEGSSSKAEAAAYDPYRAAHDTEVGDNNFSEKNYRGALMRYRDALQQKRGDAAIHLRIGRALEKLKETEPAYLAYDATLKLEPAGKSAAEASAGMERLARTLKSAGQDPESLARDDQPDPPPCLAPPATK
jgi:tetratricopeptide (TPR) repeat protein